MQLSLRYLLSIFPWTHNLFFITKAKYSVETVRKPKLTIKLHCLGYGSSGQMGMTDVMPTITFFSDFLSSYLQLYRHNDSPLQIYFRFLRV